MKHQLFKFPCQPPEMEPVLQELLAIRKSMLEKESVAADVLYNIHPVNKKSARNLLHYLAFRTHDVRELQLELSELGLSSLGRAERKLQATIDTVLHVLHANNGLDWEPKEQPPVCFREGRQLLEEHTEKLLGEAPNGRRVRIMVTMPTEAAENYDLVKNLMLQGMNCARINCAHDDAAEWIKMIENIRRAEYTTESNCRILMDLGGPKLRTGSLPLQPAVVKVRPTRNKLGEVTEPAYIWLFPEGTEANPPADVAIALPMSGDWLRKCKVEDRVQLVDSRGSNRRLEVVEVTPEGCLLTSNKTIYFKSGLTLRIERKKLKLKDRKARLVVDLPQDPGYITLWEGDLLLLTSAQEEGHPAMYDEMGALLKPATISCTLPSIFTDVKMGEPIWFDDGKIGGIVEKASEEQLQIRINHARPQGEKLRSEKGINLPETELRLDALTEDDRRDLRFIVTHADMVGLSFANRPKDIELLVDAMHEIQEEVPAIVLKIETRRGFDNLPAMLLKAMESPVCGVMIARGDLAIECGFGRLAEVQEQVLWVCEAAHVPVIWATQVLEGLTKQGLPTRAEVTDAAMGQRAECIMLNKGEHIVEATSSLKEILFRMQDHQTKKRSMLRKLHVAEKFFKQQNKVQKLMAEFI